MNFFMTEQERNTMLLACYHHQQAARRSYPPTSTDFGKIKGVENRALHKKFNPEYIESNLFMGAIECAFRDNDAEIKIQSPDRFGKRIHRIMVLLGISEDKSARREMDEHVRPETRRSIQIYITLPLWMEPLLPKELAKRDHKREGHRFRLGATEFCIGLMAMGYPYGFLKTKKSRRQMNEEKVLLDMINDARQPDLFA